MSTEKRTKINKLLSSVPAGIVLQSSWLSDHGYSHDLQKRYRKSNWFTTIGTGAMIRNRDKVSLEGALYALQKQSNLSIHLGGRTALSYLGKTQYLELSPKKVTLFGLRSEHLPKWLTTNDWGVGVDYHPTSFLPTELGLDTYEFKGFSIKISGAARALMECLYLATDDQDLLECLQVMEGLNNLRPQQVQALLENCESIKVKRIFMYMAELIGHSWLKYLKTDKIDLGKGKRSMVKNGVYVDKYQITLPKEVTNYGK